jgi:hypothetical protein
LDLTDTTHIEIGGGYEWLEWGNTNDNDSYWTFSAEATQQLGDTLSLTGHAKLGASEYVYGGGLAFDLSNGGMNTNTLGVNYSYIDGKNGIEDDQRVELSWTIGFGAGPSKSVAAADLTDTSGKVRAAADVATILPTNNLLYDVMRRPGFLPERVLGRAATEALTDCSNDVVLPPPNIPNLPGDNVFVWYFVNDPNVETDHAVFLNGNITDEFVTIGDVEFVRLPIPIEVFGSGVYNIKRTPVFSDGAKYTLTYSGGSCLITAFQATETVTPPDP